MSKKKMWSIITLFAVFSLLVAACGCSATPTEAPPVEEPPTEAPPTEAPPEAAATEVQVCALLAVGLDQGWDRTFFDSFERVVAAQPVEGLSVKELKYIEGLWGDEAESAMREFAESGECDIVWPHGGYNDNIDNIKADYPDIMFVEVGSGVLEYGGNNYHFWLRCHEPSYAMGVLAGHLSETNIFGGVGTYPASDSSIAGMTQLRLTKQRLPKLPLGQSILICTPKPLTHVLMKALSAMVPITTTASFIPLLRWVALLSNGIPPLSGL
jgi:basic membrane lipoprotein Med (substrate-binding protein (PBP1-ABC) superfamily)